MSSKSDAVKGSGKASGTKNTGKSVLPTATAETFAKVKRNAANQMENTMQNAAEHIEKTSKEFMSRMEEAATFNRSNMEAMVEAANVWAEGTKDISQALFTSLQQSLQQAMQTGKAMLGVKSLRDVVELQNEYVKSTLDSVMSESTRISEIAVRCTTEAAEPLNARVTEVVEKISERAKKAA